MKKNAQSLQDMRDTTKNNNIYVKEAPKGEVRKEHKNCLEKKAKTPHIWYLKIDLHIQQTQSKFNKLQETQTQKDPLDSVQSIFKSQTQREKSEKHQEINVII